MNTVAQAVQILSVKYSIRPAHDKLDKRFGRFVKYIDLNLRLTGPAYQEVSVRTQGAALDLWPGEIVSLIAEYVPLPERYAVQSVEYQPDEHYLTVCLMTGLDEHAEDVRRIGFEAADFEEDKPEDAAKDGKSEETPAEEKSTEAADNSHSNGSSKTEAEPAIGEPLPVGDPMPAEEPIPVNEPQPIGD